MYRNQSDFKKPYSGKPSGKYQGSESTRWDHNGYDQLNKEGSQAKNGLYGNSFRNAMNNDRDSNQVDSASKLKESKNESTKSSKKWLHDKFTAEPLLLKETESSNDISIKKDKKPDIQLYKPRRGKYAEGASSETIKVSYVEKPSQIDKVIQIGGEGSQSGDSERPVKQPTDEKDSIANDDAISVASNASTNVSDKGKGIEEKVELLRSEGIEHPCLNDSPPIVEENEAALLFEFSLGGDSKLKLYNGQFDYGQIIHDFVNKHCGEEPLALQLQIYIAKKLKGSVVSKRLDEYYTKLMEQYIQLIVTKGAELGFDRNLVIFVGQQVNNKTNNTFTKN